MFDHLSSGRWWDRAWSLVDGCAPVSPGCDHCWSAAMAQRFRPGDLTSSEIVGGWTGEVRPRIDRIDVPLKVKKPTVWAVWNDLGHGHIPESFLVDAFVSMAMSPQHLFLLLTKRPQTFLHFSAKWLAGELAIPTRGIDDLCGFSWPVPNVWFGTTAENQEQADKRIPILLETPAAGRFVSLEPLLGPVDLRPYLPTLPPYTPLDEGPHVLDWVIAGPESGINRRSSNIAWFNSVLGQAKATGIPYFQKALEINGKISKNMEEWPSYIRIREVPLG